MRHTSLYLVGGEGVELVSLHPSLDELLASLAPRLAPHQSLRLSQEVGQQNLQDVESGNDFNTHSHTHIVGLVAILRNGEN